MKRPLRVLAADGSPRDLNADNEDFLFPGDDESRFPNRRDVLRVRIALPENAGEFSLLVHHAKSRLGGRAVTDPRREAAARALVEALDTEFDGKLFVLLGDFNDNGDDRSLNILETGDPDAPGGKEEIDGPFLLNLTEALLAADSRRATSRATASTPGKRAAATATTVIGETTPLRARFCSTNCWFRPG